MKDGLQQDILDKKIDLTKYLADKINNKAPETDDAPPMGPDIVKNRQKLEAAVSYIAESNLHHAAEMEKYLACDKDNTAANLMIMTGAELRGKPVHDALSNIPQIGPALGKVFGGIFGVEGAYYALGHIEEHNKECRLKEILDQPNSEEITLEKLCEETQKQAKENPFDPPKPTVLPSWLVSTESKITSISRDIPAKKKTITLPQAESNPLVTSPKVVLPVEIPQLPALSQPTGPISTSIEHTPPQMPVPTSRPSVPKTSVIKVHGSQTNGHNRRVFDCIIGRFPPESFTVLCFETQHRGLSETFECRLDLLVPRHLSPEQLKAHLIQLNIRTQDTQHYHVSGHVFRYEKGLEQDSKQYHLTLWIRPWLARLQHRPHSRVFVDQTPQQITQRIFTEHRIPSNDWRWHANTRPPVENAIPLLLQIDENDYDFLTRLWARHGVLFSFECTAQTTILHLAPYAEWRTCLPGCAQPKRLEYCAPKGMTHQVNTVIDWSYTLSQQEQTCAQLQLSTLAHNVYPGQLINFVEPEHPDISGTYQIVHLETKGDLRTEHSALHQRPEGALDYLNILTLVPIKMPFKPMLIEPPVHLGLWSAKVENQNANPKPDLDSAGQYHLRFSFDKTTVPVHPSSPRIAFAQPLAGPGYGIHFPLRHDTRVATTLRNNGDKTGHEVTVIGTLPDEQTPSPIDQQHPGRHCFRTHRENTFEADDQSDRHYTALSTAHRDNEIKLESSRQHERILMQSKTGAIALSAEQNIDIQTNQDFYIDIHEECEQIIENQHQAKVKGKVELSSPKFTIQSKQETRFHSATTLEVSAEKRIQWSAGQIFSLCAAEHATFVHKEHHLKAQKNINLTSQGDEPLIIAQNNAQISIDSDGNVQLSAHKVVVSAPQITLRTLLETNG